MIELYNKFYIYNGNISFIEKHSQVFYCVPNPNIRFSCEEILICIAIGSKKN